MAASDSQAYRAVEKHHPKWVRAPEATQPAYLRCAAFNKLSPFHETLEQAFKADSFRAKHNRRSGKALFEQIKAESYDGGYPLIERKPGALRNGAPFADLPKSLLLLKRGLRRHANGDRVMTQVLAAVPIAGLDAVLVAVELVLESGSLSADHILNVLARLTSTAPPPSAETSLQFKVAPVANTASYERLRATDEEARNA